MLYLSHKCKPGLTKQPAEDNFNGFVVLPYVQDVSIGRILKQRKVKVAYKLQQTINRLFPRPKERESQKSGIVYKVNCTERLLKTRISEHKSAVASFGQNSKVASHVHQFSHNMNFAIVTVVGFESN